MSGLLQHEGGCVLCGKLRFTMQEWQVGLSPSIRNVYCYTIDENGEEQDHQLVVGMCEECWHLEEYDYEAIIQSLVTSEEDFAIKRKKDSTMRDKIAAMVIGRHRKKPRDAKTQVLLTMKLS